MIPSSHKRVMLSDPEAALRLWGAEATTYGSDANGVVFCSSHKDADRYLRLTERDGVLPSYRRTRFTGGACHFDLPSGARLSLHPILRLEEVNAIAAQHWPFMVFHNPASWQDRSLIKMLLPRLMSSSGRTCLVSVGTSLAETAAQPEKPKGPDFSAITRALSRG